jgi:heme-degrading monooxygenase HmoA
MEAPEMGGLGNETSTIMRIWTGTVRTADRAVYAAYVEETGMREYRQTPGNLAAHLLLRDLPDGLTEVMTVSHWDSVEAIEAFAGKNIGRAVFYPQDDRYLVDHGETVRHYEVVPPG